MAGGLPRNKVSRGKKTKARKRKAEESASPSGQVRGVQLRKTSKAVRKSERKAQKVRTALDGDLENARTEEESAFQAEAGISEDRTWHGEEDELYDAEGVPLKLPEDSRAQKSETPPSRVEFDRTKSQSEAQDIFEQKYYTLLERISTPEPMLSFDFVNDIDSEGDYSCVGLEAAKTKSLKITTICGFQFKNPLGSTMTITQLDNLRVSSWDAMNVSDSSDSEEEKDGDSEDDNETLRGQFRGKTVEDRAVSFGHPVNRLRVNPFNSSIVAAWTESDGLSILSTARLLESLNKRRTSRVQVPSIRRASVELFQWRKHRAEGFALDWSRVKNGRIATGASNGSLCVLEPRDENASSWSAGSAAFSSHSGSVEDLKWSPGEKNVFASGSADKSIKFWDVRSSPFKCISEIPKSHASDVNALSWNRYEHHLVLSGGNEGTIKVWDLRMLVKHADAGRKPVGELSFHKKPIAWLEWHPFDTSMFVACSWDDSVTIWDLSCERDVDVELSKGCHEMENSSVPPQLLFTHKARGSVTEVHWHPAYDSVLVSSSETGMDIFKPCNVKSAK